MQGLLSFVNQWHSDCCPTKSVAKWQVSGVLQVVAVPLVQGVRLLLHDEDDVGGDAARDLVTLLGEGDLGARLPARLHVDAHHLVLLAPGAGRIQHLARDLHLLRAALVQLLEREPELVFDRGVLPLSLAATGGGGEAHVSVAGTPKEYVLTSARAATPLPEGVSKLKHSRPIRGEECGIASTYIAEYALERVLITEELGEDVSWVCIESVGATSKAGLALQTLLSNLVINIALASCSERKETQSHACTCTQVLWGTETQSAVLQLLIHMYTTDQQ